MIDKIRQQIGILEGVIIQNYSFFDIGRSIKSMFYLDLTSNKAFEDSIERQKIQIYREYYMLIPQVKMHVELAD